MATLITSTPLMLAEGGIPRAQIVLPEGASAVEEYAAEELRRHLNAIAGAGPYSWPTNRAHEGGGSVISLNDPAGAQAAGLDVAELALGPEAFHLETRGNTLYILGGSPRGLLYGVYELLESLGCRWFTPEITQIPHCPTCTLPPLCKTMAPAFEFRDMFNWEGSDPVWWARNRLNGWYTPVPEYLGGHIDYGLFVHTFYTLLPPEEFFTDHPEYYSEIDGVRRHEMGQLCLSNPEVLRLVSARVLERMRANPRATIFSVSQNDWAGPCACPRCAAMVAEEGAQSGPLLRFVNAVAEATSREFPHKLIDTLAYWYTLDAPRHVVPHRNVRVRLCSINCCQAHEYGTCDHPESARFLRALDDSGRVTRQMYIWHYCTNFANYPLPVPDFDEIHANINLYKRRGVYGIFMQGMGEEGGGAESMALRGYVLQQAAVEPRAARVLAAIDEFLAAYYGAAAPHVRQYLELFHARVREERTLHPSLYDPPTSALFAGEILPRAETALAAGEGLLRGADAGACACCATASPMRGCCAKPCVSSATAMSTAAKPPDIAGRWRGCCAITARRASSACAKACPSPPRQHNCATALPNIRYTGCATAIRRSPSCPPWVDGCWSGMPMAGNGGRQAGPGEPMDGLPDVRRLC